jgi:N-acetylmuramoyl-L-alanine amidase
MKYNLLHGFVAALLVATAHGQGVESGNAINRLNWVEVSRNQLSTQIMFDFDKPLQFKKRVDKAKHQLQFLFPGMNLRSFNPNMVSTKLMQLKALGMISNVTVSEKNNNGPKIMLAIEFSPYRTTTDKATNATATYPNKLLIKWSTLENPNRLIVDIFLKEDLDKLTQRDAVFLHATNDVMQTDTNAMANLNPPVPIGEMRIVIDAGHGGPETGAKAWGLVEKEIALDIAKRVYKKLKDSGYQTSLTRNRDVKISLKDRAQLACQLGAKRFVSIHVNASADIKGHACGIETYYLNNTEMMPARERTGFLFVNLEKDVRAVYQVARHLQATMQASQKLAQSIQQNLLLTLNDNKFKPVNRGVKPEKFRTFLQSGIPAALVEVGFITNKREAELLATSSYRKNLAEGIYRGIRASLGQ